MDRLSLRSMSEVGRPRRPANSLHIHSAAASWLQAGRIRNAADLPAEVVGRRMMRTSCGRRQPLPASGIQRHKEESVCRGGGEVDRSLLRFTSEAGRPRGPANCTLLIVYLSERLDGKKRSRTCCETQQPLPELGASRRKEEIVRGEKDVW